MDYDTSRAIDEVRGELRELQRDLEYDLERVRQDLNALSNRIEVVRQQREIQL